MYSPNDPVGKVTGTMAKLFALLADEVIGAVGEEQGEAIVRSAVRKFAVMRAEGIKERIRAAGKEITFETVDEFSDYPPNNAWDCTSSVDGDTLVEVNRACPFATAFREIGLEHRGRLYCDVIDVAMNETFFGKIDFKRTSIFSDGPTAHCDMIVTKLS